MTEHGVQDRLQVAKRARETGRRDDGRACGSRELEPWSVHEMVEHRPPIGGRNRLHGVGQVAVEAREEPEAVLSRQVPSSVGSRARDRDRARLAARAIGAPLEDAHREVDAVPAPRQQLVRDAEAGDASADDRDALLARPTCALLCCCVRKGAQQLLPELPAGQGRGQRGRGSFAIRTPPGCGYFFFTTSAENVAT